MARRRQKDYLSLAMHMRCNLACKHCMIEGTMDEMAVFPDDRFEAVLQQQAVDERYRGLILTGAEITLRSDLPDLARRARASGFDRVRIQTHAMRFASTSYCERVVEGGVNEFFVSLTAGTAATHDGITGVPGSFEKTIQGLTNLDQLANVTLITNTVITERSYRELEQVVEVLGHLHHLEQVEFWNYWPMRESDDKGLLADNVEVLPHLRAAVRAAKAQDRAVVVQNFPECLLREDTAVLDNALALSEIDGRYWVDFEKNHFGLCPHRRRCSSTSCWGLTGAYVERFGTQAEYLTPFESDPAASIEVGVAVR